MQQGFWSRAGGVGGIVFFLSFSVLITLMPLSHSVSEPAFNASSSAFLAYAKSESQLPSALELVGVAGIFGFAIFGTAISQLGRLVTRASVPAALVLVATAAFVVLWLGELAIRLAGDFRREGLDATSASILFGIQNGIFVISWAAIGGFLLAVGGASLDGRALPSWLALAAIVIGAGNVLAIAAPLTALWLLPYVLFFLWVLVASVLLLRKTPST